MWFPTTVRALTYQVPAYSTRVVLRMLKLQDTKTNLAEAALGEGGGVKLHKLSVKELKTVRVACRARRT